MKQGDLVLNRRNIPGIVINASIKSIFDGADAVMSVLWSGQQKPKLTLSSLIKKVNS
jgi:hypothetical protein